jgi:hypothetical protein
MDPQKTYSFAQVLQDEHRCLQTRNASSGNSKERSDDTENFSICLSGGGIRSAAFNLGVLQALAEKKLLRNIDYLSTVSGGGYIGSWFMALLKRSSGIQEVQELLDPQHTIPGQQVEPSAIHYLRTHSNYLAPKVGIFSTDLWALWAIYLRNTFLNTLVLAPLLLAMVFLLRYFRFFQTVYVNDSVIPIVHIVLGAFCIVMASAMIGISLARCRKRAMVDPKLDWRISITDFFWLPVFLFAMATAFLGAGIRYYKQADQNWLGEYFKECSIPSVAFWVFLVGGILQVLAFNSRSVFALFQKSTWFNRTMGKRRQPLRWILSGLLGGGTLALSLYLIAVFFPLLDESSNQNNIDTKSGVSTNVINSDREFVNPKETSSFLGSDELLDDWLVSLLFGSLTPVVLLAFSTAQSLQVGILGSLETREVREKWSFLHAYCAVAGLGWLGAVILSVVLPDWIYGQVMNGKYLIPTSVGTIGVTTLSGAVWVAQGFWVGKSKQSLLDGFVKIGPYLALAMGFVLVGLIAEFIVHHLPNISGKFALGAKVLCMFIGCIAISLVASRYVDVNIFSLQEMYENRLVSAFLGASHPMRNHADPVTHIDPHDDLKLDRVGFGNDGVLNGPIHLINTTINLSGTDRREYDERKGDSFVLSPLFCGSELTGYRKTDQGYAGGLTLGRAFATSGAAVSPNMGYYSTAAVTALLTFCNLRLGSWFPNPNSKRFKQSGPKYGWFQIVREILGYTDANEEFVYLSDGGHFDNLGAYELVRRRCKRIFICDAGADPKGACHELALLIRKARIDFGVTIDIDVSTLKRSQETGFSKEQVAVGEITYPADEQGITIQGAIVYLKLNITERDSTDLKSYQIRNPDFPHQSTLNQFYSESQFESYRYLGYSIAKKGFCPNLESQGATVK